jgi:Na+/H+-dicarboxylate symporter
MSTTFFAIIVSLLYMNIFSPGVGFEATYESFESTNTAQLSMSSFLLSMIPSNVISPFLTNNAMQLVFMAFIFGIASLVIVDKKKVEQVYHASNTITEIVLKFTTWIIALTPFGIFGLISSLIAKNGLSPILDLWQFVLVILAGLFTHMLITLPLLASILGKFNPYKYLIKMKEVVLFAFSTASSSATLPLNLTKTVEVGKVDKKIAELVLPIGATVNMDGTALYQAGVALFVAQMVGIDLDLSQQITIAIIVVLASVGAAVETIGLNKVRKAIDKVVIIAVLERFLCVMESPFL